MSVFRELFVEVPAALLEDAVLAAQPQPAPRQRPQIDDYTHVLSARYGLTRIEAWRSEADLVTRIWAELGCGHGLRISVSELALAAADNVLDAVRAVVERAPRACYCVERP